MSRRPGFALLVSLLMVMTLSLVGLGVMALGTREVAIASAVRDGRQARATAEAAALDFVSRWPTARPEGLLIGHESLAVPDGEGAAVTTIRVGSDLWVVRARWTAPGGTRAPATATAALLVRTVDSDRLTARLPAAATVDETATLQGGVVRGDDGCGPTGPGVWTDEVAGPVSAAVSGSPPVQVGPAPAGDGPDPFAPGTAAEVATVPVDVPRVTPAPVATAGTCTPRPGNWGAIDPTHPCHDLRPVIHSAGPLTVSGGVARAVLVVDGDLRLEDGARVDGIILVTGTLVVDGASEIRGAVRARDLVLRSGSILRSRCTVDAVLAGPALRRAFRPPGRWWIPAF